MKSGYFYSLNINLIKNNLGVRQRGLQSTEEMLRDGAIITGIGELSKTVARSGGIRLQPPLDGTPYYLTSMSVTSLLRKLDDRRRTYRLVFFIFPMSNASIDLLNSFFQVVVSDVWRNRTFNWRYSYT